MVYALVSNKPRKTIENLEAKGVSCRRFPSAWMIKGTGVRVDLLKVQESMPGNVAVVEI